jgi:hypothetical protein
VLNRRIILILLTSLLVFVAGALFAQTPKPPETVTLKGAPMGAVKVDHKAHAARTKCDTCHHASKPAKPLKATYEACTDCHTKTASPEVPTKLQAAFHNPAATAGVCIDCHKKAVAEGKNAPTKCMQCHKKENG